MRTKTAICRSKEAEHDKLKMMMADNKIYSLGVDNLEMIESIIAELGAESDFDIPGYDAELLETLTFNPVDADEFMSGYGILEDSQKDAKEKAAVRYEQEAAAFAADAVQVSPVSAPATPPAPETGETQQGNIGAGSAGKPLETARIELQRRFIVCPKCGEKIWL